MTQNISNRVLQTIRRFNRNRSGNYALIFGLVFTALIGAGGMALDYGYGRNQQARLKDALDAALLGAMSQKHTKDEQIAYAHELLSANLIGVNSEILDIDIVAGEGEDWVLSGTISARTKTALLGAVGINEMNITTGAGVIRGPQSGHPLCIMAMHPTRKHTLEMKGKVSLHGTKCHIYGNSNHVNDVVDPHTPHNFITAASVTAVGYGHHYIQNITPPLEGSVNVIPDPYLTKTLPAIGSCKATGLEIEAQTITLDPGTYCDGLTISDGSHVTLNPGLYVVIGDTLEIEESTLEGTGVTLFLADRHAELSVSESTVRLVAPTSGPWTSFVILTKRDYNTWEFEESTLDMYGIVYAPGSDIEWENAGTPVITAEWTAWINDGFSWSGTGTLNFPYDTEGSVVPHPSSLNVIPRPGLHEVVRLAY